LPSIFSETKAIFHFEDGTVTEVFLFPGEMLSDNNIPTVNNTGIISHWNGIDKPIYFDSDIYITYDSFDTVFESTQKRENDLPVLLAECSPSQTNPLIISFEVSDLPDNAIDAFSIVPAAFTKLRYLPPLQYRADQIQIYYLSEDGTWKTVDHTVQGSYAHFDPKESTSFCVLPREKQPVFLWLAIIVIFLGATTGIVLLVIQRKKKSNSKS